MANRNTKAKRLKLRYLRRQLKKGNNLSPEQRAFAELHNIGGEYHPRRSPVRKAHSKDMGL